jgi:hypothetical protein
MRADEQVRVGEQPPDAAETVDGAGGLVEKRDDLVGKVLTPRQRSRVERPEPADFLANVTSLLGGEGVGTHAGSCCRDVTVPKLAIAKGNGSSLYIAAKEVKGSSPGGAGGL